MKTTVTAFLLIGLFCLVSAVPLLLRLRDPMSATVLLSEWKLVVVLLLDVAVGFSSVFGALGLRQSRAWARVVLEPICWLAIGLIPVVVGSWAWNFLSGMWSKGPAYRTLSFLLPWILGIGVLVTMAAAAVIWFASAIREVRACAQHPESIDSASGHDAF